ncbi:MAG: hypothetical protein J6M93_02260 [Succinivibrio sp.]|nr:hypothetical protein [Succinivibrio sp.]
MIPRYLKNNNIVLPFVFVVLSLLLSGCDRAPKPDSKELSQAINEVLKNQTVIIPAPGFPSKMEELMLVLEDPSAPQNAKKPYHPAEKIGWEGMIDYARAYEKQGAMTFEKGTFEERNFFDEAFSFTGFRLRVTDVIKGDTVVIPSLGRVGFKAGVVTVKDIVKTSEPQKQEDKSYTIAVTYTSAVGAAKNWLNDEILEKSGAKNRLLNEETVNVTYKDGKYSIGDEAFIKFHQKPYLAFDVE